MKAILLVLALFTVACKQKKKLSYDTKSEKPNMKTSSTEIRKVKPTDLKTGPEFSTPVISNAQKFIIPVPAFKDNGEHLVYPKNHQKAGQPILDYEGKPIGNKGIVFFNFKDQSLQSAPDDGEAVIIVNEVNREQALKLEQEIEKIKSEPESLSLKELKQIIAYAHDQLNLTDMYNSTHSFVKKNMTAVVSEETSKKRKVNAVYGLKKRDNRDINQAFYIPGEFVFEGPSATPQKFENGGVILEHGGEMRGIQPDIFMRTYQLADGTRIQSLERDIRSQLRK